MQRGKRLYGNQWLGAGSKSVSHALLDERTFPGFPFPPQLLVPRTPSLTPLLLLGWGEEEGLAIPSFVYSPGQ